MTRFKLYFDKDEEIKWLNEMADKGYAMTGFFAGFYRFDECEPGEWEYQIDFGDKFYAVTDDYKEFMKEADIEIVQTWGFWVILRRKKTEQPFRLYTDVDSSIEHYTKIRTMFKVAIIFELICFVIEGFCVAKATYAAIACMFIIGLMIVVLIRAAMKTNAVIEQLRERKGEASVKCKEGKQSPILLAGLLLNSCTLILQDFEPHEIRWIVQIVAIIFMVIGIYQSRWVFTSKDE